MVEEGVAAPDFSLTSDTGDTVSLASLRGKPVVLYRSTFVIDADDVLAALTG